MARVRGSNTGFAVALVIFGCAFVIATLVAIILYTKIETAKAGEETALEDRRKYVSDSETGPANDYLKPGSTVYATLKAENDALKDELRQANDSVTSLKADTTSMESAFNEQVTQADDLRAQLTAASSQSETILAERDRKVASLLKDKEALTGQIAGLQKKVTESIANADGAAQARIAELNESLAVLQGQLAEAKDATRVAIVERDRIAEQLPKVPVQNATLPDGKIASMIEKSNDLFITLGRRDGLVIGMTFEIYDPDPVLKLDDQGAARGKATIEVYRLHDDSALCRIVRLSRLANVEVGDPIVNVGYDPNKDIKMAAFGYFDIERDGGVNDLGRVNALILKSGAELVTLDKNDKGNPILTPDLDYIVLGEKPELPDPPSADDFDPAIQQEYRKKLEENEAYFTIVEDAKRLRIPVMNLNRFLQLTGYYER